MDVAGPRRNRARASAALRAVGAVGRAGPWTPLAPPMTAAARAQWMLSPLMGIVERYNAPVAVTAIGVLPQKSVARAVGSRGRKEVIQRKVSEQNVRSSIPQGELKPAGQKHRSQNMVAKPEKKVVSH